MSDISIHEKLSELIFVSVDKNHLKKAVFSKSNDKKSLKIVLTPKSIGSKKVL